jgi:uncharacterized protein (TIGR02145 family)
MKTITIILCFLLLILKIQAQDYLISFEGEGDTTVVSSVKVDNLTSGATVNLNGNDTLHLTLSVGINNLDFDNSAVQFYPNPTIEQSMLTFNTPETGTAVLSIVDLSGRTVHKISISLPAGRQSFQVSGISKGMYFVNIAGKGYNYSIKMISQSQLQGTVRVKYLGTENSGLLKPTPQLKNSTGTVDMLYSEGDLLLYKGTAGQYSTIITDVPTSNKTMTFNFVLCQDSVGQNYSIVTIGDQIWMDENLNVGIRIDGLQDQTNNSIVEKYCFNDLETNCNLYGGVYLWDEMMQYSANYGVRGICPTGWHLPTDTEWNTLTTFLGGDSIAGGKLKETGYANWALPNTGATNEAGFTTLPGGFRASAGLFYYSAFSGFFWTSVQSDYLNAWMRVINYDSENVVKADVGKNHGCSVRCIHD